MKIIFPLKAWPNMLSFFLLWKTGVRKVPNYPIKLSAIFNFLFYVLIVLNLIDINLMSNRNIFYFIQCF